ncbi:hypothetical protein Tco_0963372 [Tanacetum coccineum]
MHVSGAPECMKILGFMHGITNPDLIKKLNDNIPKSVDEMMSVTTAFLRGEVAAANQSKKKAPPAWKHHEASHRPNFDNRLDFKSQHKSNRRQDHFTPLTKTPKPYNGIIGRPGLRKIQAVPFTAHVMLKFPVKGGITMIHSTTIMPMECRMVTEAQDAFPPREPTVTEGIKVAIHLEYPEQTVTIDGILSEKERMELCNLLKENLVSPLRVLLKIRLGFVVAVFLVVVRVSGCWYSGSSGCWFLNRSTQNLVTQVRHLVPRICDLGIVFSGFQTIIEPSWLASVVGLVLCLLCGLGALSFSCAMIDIVKVFGFVVFASQLTLLAINVVMALLLCHPLIMVKHDGFTLALFDSLFAKGLRTVKSIPPKCRLGFSRALRGALDKVICKADDISSWVSLLVLPLCILKTFCSMSNLECKSANKHQREEESITNAIRSWGGDLDLSEWNLKQCRRKICDGHYTAAVRYLSSSGVAPYGDATLHELKAKHPFKSALSLPDTPIDHQHLIASLDVVLDRIKIVAILDELVSFIIQVVNLFLEGKCPMMLGEYIASVPLILLVKTGGVWCWVPRGGEAILHAVNRLVEDRRGDVDLSMLLNSATLALPDCTTEITPCGHAKGDSFNLFLQAWYLDDGTIVGDTFVVGGPVSVDLDFGNTLVMKRVSKAIGLLDAVAQINDPQCDVLNYAFIASCLQYATLQPKLLRHEGIVAYGSTFDDALCVFNNVVEIDFLSNPSEVVAFRLMKKMADIYFTRVTKDVESYFSLSPWQMALWQSQREEHTLDWLRVVPISGLGHTMNGKTYRCVLCYRLGVPLFSVSKPCSACSKVFTGDVYGDHAVSCTGVIGIKHRRNAVRDTLVDICFRSGISAGKEVDIGLGGGCDKALRPADMLLYSWEGGLDVCVDLTGSSPLTQTGMADFVPGRAMIDAAQRKRGSVSTASYWFDMAVVRFHCPFVGLSGCHDGGENGLTKTSLIIHLRDRHCNGDAQVITRKSLSTNLAIFEEAEGSDFVSPPDCGDGVVRFVLYDIIKPYVPSSSEQLDHVDDLVQVQHEGFTLALLDSLFSKGLRTVKSIPPKCRLGFSLVLKNALDKAICTPDDISCWVSLLVLPLCLLKTFHPKDLDLSSQLLYARQEESIVNVIRSWSLPGGSMQVMGETLAESSPLLSYVDEEEIDLGE